MKKPLYTTIALVTGIIIMVNLLSTEFHFRLDLTEGGQYTLSGPTRDILRGLDEPVTVKAYFSKSLPPNVEKSRKDFQDMLVEYSNLSGGKLQYEFVNPNESDATEQDAQQKGIRPVMIDVRDKDQMKQQKAYLGAIVSLGEKQEVIPFLQPGAAMEYALSTAIKKLSIINKPTIGILQGQGEPSMDEIGQLAQQLQILYQTQAVSLTDSTDIPGNIHTLALIRPTDSLRPGQLEKLDSFLARGGRLMIAFSQVEGNIRYGEGRLVSTGLKGWLAGKGLDVGNNCVIDAECGAVPMQQQAGAFSFQSNVSLPYLPIIGNFANHPVTTGLERVMLEFPSTINYSGHGNLRYTPLAFTSALSDSVAAPLPISVNRQWSQSDFHASNLVVGAALEGNFGGAGVPSKMVVISDGNFIVNGSAKDGRELAPDNVNLVSNAIDWLADNTGLIGLRTKAVTSRPLHELSESAKAAVKYLNFLLPVLLAIGYGLMRARKNRMIRQQRMNENYGSETAPAPVQ